jgi:O-antigen ligase
MEERKTAISFTKWKPIEIMLAVLFLIAPFYYHPNIGGSGLRVPNNIAVWILAIIIIWYTSIQVLKKPKFVIPKYFIFVAMFPIIITLTGFVIGVEQPLRWLSRLLFVWGGLALFFSLYQHNLKQGRLDRLLFIIVVSALVHSLFGIAQIWFKNDMSYLLPISDIGIPSGFFQQINNQATYQVTAIMIALYLMTRPYLAHGPKYALYILALAVACAGFVVCISGSRIGLLSLIVGLIIIIPALWKKFKTNKKHSLAILLALMMGSSFGLTLGQDQFSNKTIAMQSGFSGSARLVIYDISLELIKQEPIFGHGIASFPRTWQYAKPDFYKTHPDATLINGFVSHPHNEILFWLLEGGLVAGMGLVVFFVSIALTLKRLGWHRGGAYAAMLLPFSLHTQVELPFYSSAIHWMLFIFMLMLIMNSSIHSKRLVMSTAAIKSAVVTATLFSLIILLSLVHTIRAHYDFIEFYGAKEALSDPFRTALQNPYLSEDTRYIDMSSFLYSSIEQGSVNAVRVYTKWGEKRLLESPHIKLYEKLVDAYYFLQDKVAYCRILEQGISLYPGHGTFKKGLAQCEK